MGSSNTARSLKEYLYYNRWMACPYNKNGSIRGRDITKALMNTVYNNNVITKDKANKESMSIQKVERVELFGGLKYTSCEYYMFISRMEYVFMNLFTPEKLVIIGSDLVTNVFKELSSNPHVKTVIIAFDPKLFEEADKDGINDVIIHMTRTYCQMMGKDFV